MVNTGSRKLGSWLNFAIGLVVIIILNQLIARYFFRVDLTEEKRYTISPASREILNNLKDVVYVDVYLEGDFPPAFKRLQKSIRETLEEFKVYAGDNLEFRFIDPSTATGQKARNEFYKSLAEKGIQPTNLYDNVNGKQVQNLIFPGAVISYGGKETGVMLLKYNQAASAEEKINQSIEGLEYNLTNAIKKITEPQTKKIAILDGNGELDTLHSAGLNDALMGFYRVYRVNLTKRPDLSGFDAIVVAKPQRPFSEFDKYKIDQFLMRGGKAMFLIDQMTVDMDSASGPGTVALPIDLNLDDLFFRYGIRFNKDLVIDLNAAPYPVVVGNMGEKPEIKLMPWPFFPLANNFSQHPIVRNLDAVYCRFVSTIDTVKSVGVTKTPLVFTSKYSKVLSAPVRVSINDIKGELKPEFFNSGPQAISWLYEGKFTSLYKNRFLPDQADKSNFIADGAPTKIIVFADGDVAKNEVNPKTGQPLELGYDQFTQTKYANADFLVNGMEYLLDEHGIINARSKEFKIRPLDKVKVSSQRVWWQLVNLLVPIGLVVAFGLVKNMVRKKKFANFKNESTT